MNITSFSQIITAVILIILILFQQKGTALGSAFGGGGGDTGFYATKRGIQQKIYYATIIFGVIFIALALINLIISSIA